MSMRVVKKPEERKAEILSVAEELFAAKGYEKTSVNNIIESVGLSKGAFYYYFKSKEEVLDEIIEKLVSEGVKRAEEIADSPLPPLQKVIAMFMAQQFHGEYKLISAIFKNKGGGRGPNKIAALKKCDIQYIFRLSPCFGKAIEEGINAGLFSTPFPVESARILLCAGLTLFDWDSSFKWTEDEAKTEVAAFLLAMERIVGAKAKSFSEFQNLFARNIFYPYFQNLEGGTVDKQHEDTFTEGILNILRHSGGT